jgi:hypothetical protein
MPGLKLTLFIALLGATSCVRDRQPPTGAIAATADAQDRPYPPGTVGAALNGYWVDMPRIRKWYQAMDSVSRYAQRDSLYHLSLNLPLESQLDDHLGRLEQDSIVRRAVTAAQLTTKDFVLLTGVVAIDRMTRHLVDSLGPTGRPTNVGEELSAFFSTHRREIDSIEARLGGNQ